MGRKERRNRLQIVSTSSITVGAKHCAADWLQSMCRNMCQRTDCYASIQNCRDGCGSIGVATAAHANDGNGVLIRLFDVL